MRGRTRWAAASLVAYAAAGAAVWATLGLGLGALGANGVVIAAALLYALWHGALETLRLPVHPPGSRWQVPATWVRHRAPLARIGVWGAILGPGVVTRNPFASMWMIPLLLALADTPARGAAAGAVAGAAHGLARAAGVIRNTKLEGPEPHLAGLVLAQMRWRLADGIVLLIVAGALLGVVG